MQLLVISSTDLPMYSAHGWVRRSVYADSSEMVAHGQLANTISDPIGVCRTLSSHQESLFFSDMARLRVLPPDTTTRVSEYVPEIVSFVERIVDRGFAYEGAGSIWFDVGSFDGARDPSMVNGGTMHSKEGWEHVYAKLQPGNKGNKKLLEEGEGA